MFRFLKIVKLLKQQYYLYQYRKLIKQLQLIDDIRPELLHRISSLSIRTGHFADLFHAVCPAAHASVGIQTTAGDPALVDRKSKAYLDRQEKIKHYMQENDLKGGAFIVEGDSVNGFPINGIINNEKNKNNDSKAS